jgi:cytochrome P450
MSTCAFAATAQSRRPESKFFHKSHLHTRAQSRTLSHYSCAALPSLLLLMQAALQQRPGTFSRPSELLQDIVKMGVDGLFTAEGERWKKYRRVTAPHFR